MPIPYLSWASYLYKAISYMFELTTAWRFLTSTRSRRSSGYLVIAAGLILTLVIWLSITFLTLSQGIESRWVEQIRSITSDVRISPTQAWFDAVADELKEIDPEETLELSADRDNLSQLLTTSPTHFTPALSSLHLLKQQIEQLALLHQYRFQIYSGTIVELRLSFQEANNPYAPHHTIEQYCYLLGLTPEHPYYQQLQTQFPSQLLAPSYLKRKFNATSLGLKDSTLYYNAATPFGSHRQQVKVEIVREYDAGILPIPLLLADPSFVDYIRRSQGSGQEEWNTGWQLWLNKEGGQSNQILPRSVTTLTESFNTFLQENRIDHLWQVQHYGQLPFTQDLVSELLNQRLLFSLLGILIVAVGATNITMLLQLLVHDRSQEIAILYALGASRFQIAITFSLAGLLIGTCSTLLGSLGASLTLHHIHDLISFISWLQNRPFLPSQFYGAHFPDAIPSLLLTKVASITILLSLLGALFPAWRATRLDPSELLKE
jgi:ABC-type lipoprotein release transport system permease subunit